MAKKTKAELSTKRVAIDQSKAQLVIIVAVAAFVTVFCLMASKAVLSQNQYQARVVTAKEKARNQLQTNIETFNDLQKSYNAFNSTATNVIGGNSEGTGDRDGNNSKIILNALPSTYDFPALTSSLEKIFKDRNIQVGSITGVDDQVAQQSNLSSPEPKAVEIPFTVELTNVSYKSVIEAIDTMQKSIRPIKIDSLEISGGSRSMNAKITAHTYYQPAKGINLKKVVIQ